VAVKSKYVAEERKRYVEVFSAGQPSDDIR